MSELLNGQSAPGRITVRKLIEPGVERVDPRQGGTSLLFFFESMELRTSHTQQRNNWMFSKIKTEYSKRSNLWLGQL